MAQPQSSEAQATSDASSAAAVVEELGVRHEIQAPLGARTWYGIGGRAEILAAPDSVDQLAGLTAACRRAGLEMRVLGAGANLLVARDVPGVVVTLGHEAFRSFEVHGHILRVGAGFDLFKLVLQAARHGLAGLEPLAGIPGSVGGAVRMNAGGTFGETGQAVRSVRLIRATGRIIDRPREDLTFGYRHTNILEPVIGEAAFDLSPEDPAALMKRVKEIFLYKKNSQPLGADSAGCAFRNPPTETGETAGRLIDRCGLKGETVGQAAISELHANFIIVRRGAEPGDVLRLLEHVEHTVAERTGIHLQREVVVWP